MGKVIQNERGVFEEVTQEQLNADESAAAIASARSFARGAAMSGISAETIEMVAGSREAYNQFQRDQGYPGNNQQNIGYMLEEGAKYLTNRLTPVVDSTPRFDMGGIDTVNYRTVLGLYGNTGPTVLSGVLGQQGTPNKVSYNWKNLSYAAKMIAISDVVTKEAQIYGRSFQGDVLGKAAAQIIPALKQLQEVWYLNSCQQLWTPPQHVASGSTTGGTIAANTYYILVTAVNANGETLGTSVTTTTTTGTTSSISLTIFTLPDGLGVTAYNVYVGTTNANASLYRQPAGNFNGSALPVNPTTGVKQGYVTAVLNAVTLSGTAYSSVVTAFASNPPIVAKETNANFNTGNPLTFDGVQSLVYLNAGSASGIFGSQSETPLVVQPAASNGALSLNDTDNLLQAMMLNAQADPDELWVSVVDHKKLSYLVAQGTNARVVLNADNASAQGNLIAGYRATAYLNQTTGKLIPIKMVPYLTQGTMIFVSREVPPALGNADIIPYGVGYNLPMYSQIFQPDQSHQTQTTISAFANEAIVIQYLGGFGIVNGITLN